jgi:hypothetical protein
LLKRVRGKGVDQDLRDEAVERASDGETMGTKRIPVWIEKSNRDSAFEMRVTNTITVTMTANTASE